MQPETYDCVFIFEKHSSLNTFIPEMKNVLFKNGNA